MFTLKRKISLYFLGYVWAVFVASFIVIAGIIIWGELGGVKILHSNTQENFGQVLLLLGLGSFFTSITALPGFCISIWLTEKYQKTNFSTFAMAGLITAILAHVLYFFLFGREFVRSDSISALVLSMPAGAIGGLAYAWLRSKILHPDYQIQS